jgi:cell division protein FtsN
VVIPEVDTAPRADAPVRAVEEPGRYVLQVGSFTALGDADRMQANLALIGIESRIQRVTIDDDVYHRVRIGPIRDLEELNQTRRRLRDARIEWLLMRVSDQ